MTIKVLTPLWAKVLKDEGYDRVPDDDTLRTIAQKRGLIELDITQPGFREALEDQLRAP